jgi:predicted RNA methylase
MGTLPVCPCLITTETMLTTRWNTARVASDTIYHLDISRGKKVLELGAGAGLPSLTAAMCGAEKVVITDYPDQSLVDNMVWKLKVLFGGQRWTRYWRNRVGRGMMF